MNWTHVKRIAWKDYRRMSGLWLALAGFWALCLIIQAATAFYWQDFQSTLTLQSCVSVVLTLSWVFALAWSAVTFSNEHEEKTYGVLRSLPLAARDVFYGKLFFGANGTLLLILALSLMSAVYWAVIRSQGGDFSPVDSRTGISDWQDNLWLGGLMFLVAAIGLFWSMKSRRPFLSLIMTGVSVIVVPATVFIGMEFARDFCAKVVLDVPPNSISGETIALASAVTMGVIALTFFIVDRRLVETWLPTGTSGNAYQATTAAAVSTRKLRGAWRSLFWLHYRQKLKFYAGLTIATVVVLVLCSHSNSDSIPYFFFVIVGILGIATFQREQQDQRYRLLAQIGVTASGYWWTMIGLPLVCVTILSVAAFVLPEKTWGDEQWRIFHGLGCFVVFAISQFWSLACRRVILGLAATLMSSIVALAWLMLMLFLQIGWWLGVAPLVLLPLLATWLRVPRWFRDTGSWRQWVVPLAPIATMVCVLPLATAAYRVWEVPSVKVSLFDPKPVTAAEREGQRKLLEVLRKLPEINGLQVHHTVLDNPVLTEWVADNPKLIEELVSTVASPAVFPDEFRADLRNQNYQSHPVVVASSALLMAGQRARKEDRLADALKYYEAALRINRHQRDRFAGYVDSYSSHNLDQGVFRQLVAWAMHEETTPDQIEAAAEMICPRPEDAAPWRETMSADYRLTRELFEDPEAVRAMMDELNPTLATLLRLAPWEWHRARRLYDLIHQRTYDAYREAEMADQEPEYLDDLSDVQKLSATTMMGGLGSGGYYIWEYFESFASIRVGSVYQLVAIAERKRTGRYPSSFDGIQLQGEPLPTDPITDQPFVLGRDGLEETIHKELSGPALVRREKAPRASGPPYSDGWGAERMFLVPKEGEWNPSRFQEREMRTSQVNKRRTQSVANRAAASVVAFPMFSEEEAAVNRYLQILPLLDTDQVLSPVQEIIRNAVRAGDSAALAAFWENPELAGEFLPELFQALEAISTSESPDLESMRKIAETLAEFPIETLTPQFDQYLSKSSEADEPRGVPLRNPNNGHYYEVLEGGSWQACLEAASRRSFRGMSGHLLTLTSEEEIAFLTRIFHREGESYWGACSREDEEETWKWVAGAEEGEVFYYANMFSTDLPQDFGDIQDFGPGKLRIFFRTARKPQFRLGPELAFLGTVKLIVEYDPDFKGEAEAVDAEAAEKVDAEPGPVAEAETASEVETLID